MPEWWPPLGVWLYAAITLLWIWAMVYMRTNGAGFCRRLECPW